MSPVVLDAKAFHALAGPPELYRPGRAAMVDACLARSALTSQRRDTDRSLARLVGGVLAAAGAGSEDLADAHVVATAVEADGGVILTGDLGDMERPAAPYPNVTVVSLD